MTRKEFTQDLEHWAREIINISYDIFCKNIKLQQRIDKAIEILGEYKHYSVPDEKQNSENEDIVDKSLEILKGDSNDNKR